MIPPGFRKHTVTRLRYPTTLDHGVAVADYTATPAELPIPGCWLEPIESQEVVDGRLAVRTGYAALLPPEADLVADDHVRYLGVEYDVDGDIIHVPSASGALDHSKATLIRWEG